MFVIGPTIVPLQVDVEKEAAQAEEIEKQAYDWFASGRSLVDVNHDKQDRNASGGVTPCQSFIARKGDPDYVPGSWVVGAIVSDPELVAKVETGELNGWSWSGPYNLQPFLALVSHPIEGSGTTERADGPYPPHDHPVEALKFDDNARVIPTQTGVRFQHFHEIKGTTRTERTHAHAHGLLIRPKQDAD